MEERTTDKPRKNKMYDTGKEKHIKTQKVHLKIKYCKFEKVENLNTLELYFTKIPKTKYMIKEKHVKTKKDI
jgi:hypothetical protein